MQGHSNPTRPATGRVPVSVAMATYNGERFLAEQLRSILSQLDGRDEVVVVDDASTDGTVEAIGAFGDPRIRVLRNERNAGVFATFERALSETRGEVVFLSDQDDIWREGKVRAVLDCFAQDPEVVLVLSDAEVVDDAGRVTQPSFMALRGGFKGSLGATMVRNRYLGCAMAFRRSLLATVLPIPRDVPMHDMWFGALAALQGRVQYIDRPLVQYRRHGGNVSPSRPQSIARMLRWRWSLLRNVMRRRRAVRHRAAAGGAA